MKLNYNAAIFKNNSSLMKTIVIRWKVVFVFEIFFSANCFANGFSGDYSEICSAFEALQKNNSQQAQMQFFKAFPSNWYEFIKTYGPGPASLYKEYDSHLSAFENLNMIDDSVYIERLIYLSLGAMKDADAPTLLQDIIRRKMFQSEKMTKRFLHFIEKLQKGHQMQFWQFFWSNLIYNKELEQKYFFLLGLLSENGKEVVSIAYHYFNGGITYPYGGPWNSPY